MTEPIRLTFEVACPAHQAFSLWTTDVGLWWPADHTMSGGPVEIRFEPHPGGRVFERTGDGRELEWGQVVRWDPPSRVAYTWHLGSGPHSATDVEVTFTGLPDGSTRVELVHDGFAALGPDGDARRDRNQTGWADVIGPFTAAAGDVGDVADSPPPP